MNRRTDARTTELPAIALGPVAWRDGTNEFPAPTDLLTDLAAGDWSHEDLDEFLRGAA